MGIGISVAAGKFDVFAFFAHQACKFFSQDGRALVVVGDDLGNCNAFFCDFAVDEEGRNSGIFCCLDGCNTCVGTGVIQDNGLSALRNAAFEEFKLLVGIIIMDELRVS